MNYAPYGWEPFWDLFGTGRGQWRSRAEPSRAGPGRAEPSRAEPSRAGPGGDEPSRAEPNRPDAGRDDPRRPQTAPVGSDRVGSARHGFQEGPYGPPKAEKVTSGIWGGG